MLRIHRKLQQGDFPSCTSLAREIECSAKTVQRDLDYLRDQLGLPLGYDAGRHGWYYAEPVTAFPTVATTEGEILALFVAEKALAQYRGTPFEKPLATALGKLSAAMDGAVSLDLGALGTVLSFRHTGVAVTDLAVFQQITHALIDRREIAFAYRKLNAKRAEKRHVQPLHVTNIDGQWYLFGHDLARRELRTFVLARIHGEVTPGKPFELPENFSLAEHLLHSFGAFGGKGEHRIRLSFDSFAAQLIRERHWHASQQIIEQADGTLELRLRLNSLEEIQRWVLSWGEHVKVLAPNALRERVRAATAAVHRAHVTTAPGPSSDDPAWLQELREAAQSYQPERLLNLVLSLDQSPEDPAQLQLFHN